MKPDKYTYTSLVKAVVHNGNVQELLYDMEEEDCQADVMTYNTVIKVLCEERKFDIAQKMVNQMEAAGVSPDSMTYGLLMSGML